MKAACISFLQKAREYSPPAPLYQVERGEVQNDCKMTFPLSIFREARPAFAIRTGGAGVSILLNNLLNLKW
jgi:hypothetical protein